MPSPLGTPNFHGFATHPLPPPSPLSFTTLYPYPSPAETDISSSTMSTPSTAPSRIPTPPPSSLPELRTYTTEDQDERIEGLRLVADAVAQQRQVASKALILHPLHIALYGIVAALLARYFTRSGTDVSIIITTLAGVTMTALAAVRYATSAYIGLAEKINWDWLGEDRVVVVKWGGEVIGTLVLGWEDDVSSKKKGGSRNGRRRGGWAVVRAWTVKLKYRGKGVGDGLLEEAVRVASLSAADGVRFADDDVVSKRVLPEFYNSFLNKRDARAQAALEKVAREKGNFGRRRYSPSHGSR
jgi:hypothetical protein